jgi:tRNA threonylcarbamoyladenosine modification (KEOPS) complex Cgi121 subunit
MPPEDASWQAWGARRVPDDRRSGPELVRDLRAALQRRSSGLPAFEFAQLFDAAAIAGSIHLGSALSRARRSKRQGRARLTDAGAELVLYVGGSDQFPESLRRVGLSSESREVVLLLAPCADPSLGEKVLRELRLAPDPSIYPRPPSPVTLQRLGISEERARSVPSDRRELLVVEAGALVDLPRGADPRQKG